MGQLSPMLQLIASTLNAVAVGRYSIACACVPLLLSKLTNQGSSLAACTFRLRDSASRQLDEEVAFVSVCLHIPCFMECCKGAYLFCRYWPLVVAPFHLWGFIGNHERHVCETHYHALYACTVPTICYSHWCPSVILMLRTYAFTGRRRTILVVLSISFFSLVGVAIWVISTQLTLTALFMIEERSACFATSNQPDFHVVRPVGAYHLGHCFQQRGTFGPLGQSFLKQGILVYLIMTALNALTIGTYFSSNLLHQGIGSWFAYILPSTLVIVLMLRRKASPTETQLHVQYSHMVDEALEMVESHPETSEGFMPSSSTVQP
ncbi:hypothetical protein EDB92DRAFT_1836252 [Lactarius akahatsu]|uniref:Uncharacterized protein n=1 Tax=Lactarius akahatsu TaxID=416441 RepID=A0AAD4QGY5_9AGAM|nr:hypothetical protein EDB92DRAFT_1836252 [Lactarius akahatsu]